MQLTVAKIGLAESSDGGMTVVPLYEDRECEERELKTVYLLSEVTQQVRDE